MCDIIPFPTPTTTDIDECDIVNPLASIAPDPFPDFKILSISNGRALMEAHVPAVLAAAMVAAVKASSHPCSFEIYKRDASTAWIDGNVPAATAVTLLEMLAA
jgi:hypothetical protein